MTAASPPESPAQQVTFLIIGAGFSGLGAAIRLKQAGYTDMVILERADDVGGTWRDNTYPGCRCDVQSNLYSYSFAPKADWSETFPSQPELWAVPAEVTSKLRAAPLPAVRPRGDRRPLGRRRQAMARQHDAGQLRRPVPDRRPLASWSSRRCRTSLASRRSPARSCTRPAGIIAGRRPAAGWPSSAPARPRSRSCRRSSRRSST